MAQTYAERKEYYAKWRKAHREELRKKSQEYFKAHPEAVHEAQKRYRAKKKLQKQLEKNLVQLD